MFEIFDLATGKSLARLKTSTTLAHGVDGDARLALRVREQRGRRIGAGQGGRRSTCRRCALAGTVDVGQQASGIAFWKMN